MMSLDTIHSLNRSVAVKAARAHRQPFVITAEDIVDLKAGNLRNVRIPNFGDFRPKGWTLVRELFVDKSGFGAPDEPALTHTQFYNELRPGFGYAMIEEGQFQAYIGEFQKDGAK